VPDDRPFRQKDVVEYPLILQATNRYIKVSHTYLFRHIFSVVSSYFSIFYRYSEWPLAGRSWVRNPVTERFSAPLQTGCGFHPVSATTGVGPFTGLNGPWRDIDIPPSSTAEIKESVNLHLHNPPPNRVLPWLLISRNFPFLPFINNYIPQKLAIVHHYKRPLVRFEQCQDREYFY